MAFAAPRAGQDGCTVVGFFFPPTRLDHTTTAPSGPRLATTGNVEPNGTGRGFGTAWDYDNASLKYELSEMALEHRSIRTDQLQLLDPAHSPTYTDTGRAPGATAYYRCALPIQRQHSVEPEKRTITSMLRAVRRLRHLEG